VIRWQRINENNQEYRTDDDDTNIKNRRYNFANISNNFMKNDTWLRSIENVIADISKTIQSKEDMNLIYTNITDLIDKEMYENKVFVEVMSTNSNKKRKNCKPYWNEELDVKWRNMVRSEKQFLKCRGNNRMIRRYKQIFMNERNSFDKTLKRAKRNYNRAKIETLEDVNTNNPTEFWKYIKQLGPHKKYMIPMQVRLDNGNLCADPVQVREKWLSDYMDLYNNFDEDGFDNNFLESAKEYKEFLFENNLENESINTDITMEELTKCIDKLKLKKAVGADAIPNEILKHEGIRSLLLSLFNKILETGLTPSIWSDSILKPIPKGGNQDIYSPMSYRAISLISCMSKLFTALLAKRVMSYIESEYTIEEEQNGFRQNRSCVDHLFSLTSLVRNRLSSNKSTYTAFIDMAKAFDSVNRELLQVKLLEYNINGKLFTSLMNICMNTRACVKVNEMSTDWFDIRSGVRQGDSISPDLFNIYINDLAREIKACDRGIVIDDIKVNILLYADDIVLLADCEEGLGQLLKVLSEWCECWRLKLNIDKTKVVHFRPSTKRCTKKVFWFRESKIEVVDNYKYLGFVLDCHMNYKDGSEVLADAGSRAFNSIIIKSKCLNGLGYKTFVTLYTSGVIPVVDYASEIWGYAKSVRSDITHNKAIKYFLGVPKYTPNAASQLDIGLLTPKYRRIKRMLQYWNRLIKMNDERLTKQLFKCDYKLGYRNWCAEIEQIFSILHQDDVYDNLKVCNIQLCMNELERLMKTELVEEAMNKSKLRYYNQFKDKDLNEPYIVNFMSRYNRSLLAKLRFGVLPLQIETDRYTRIKDDITGQYRLLLREERVCRICKNGEIEDELHFVCICDVYKVSRRILFEKVNMINNEFVEWNLQDKFLYLMKNNQKELAEYVASAWKIRINCIKNN
jgi:hypothetical protein